MMQLCGSVSQQMLQGETAWAPKPARPSSGCGCGCGDTESCGAGAKDEGPSPASVLFNLVDLLHYQAVEVMSSLPTTHLSASMSSALLSKGDVMRLNQDLEARIHHSATKLFRTIPLDAVRASRALFFPTFAKPLLSLLATRPDLLREHEIRQQLKRAGRDAGPPVPDGVEKPTLVFLNEHETGLQLISKRGERHSIQSWVISQLLAQQGKETMFASILLGSTLSFTRIVDGVALDHTTSGMSINNMSLPPNGMMIARDLRGMDILGTSSSAARTVTTETDVVELSCGVQADEPVPLAPHLTAVAAVSLVRGNRIDLLASWVLAVVCKLAEAHGLNLGVSRSLYCRDYSPAFKQLREGKEVPRSAFPGADSVTLTSGAYQGLRSRMEEIRHGISNVLDAVSSPKVVEVEADDIVMLPALWTILKDPHLTWVLGSTLKAKMLATHKHIVSRRVTPSTRQLHSGQIMVALVKPDSRSRSYRSHYAILTAGALYVYKAADSSTLRAVVVLPGAVLADDATSPQQPSLLLAGVGQSISLHGDQEDMSTWRGVLNQQLSRQVAACANCSKRMCEK